MSDFETAPVRAPEQGSAESDKVRARIPKSDWAYILGQSTLAGRTLQSIGDEYGATPSAVHYVVKMAGQLAADNKLQPSLERPATQEASAAMNDAINKARNSSSWSSRKIQDLTKPPSQAMREELEAERRAMEQEAAKAAEAQKLLQNENCKRLFDSTSKAIMKFSEFIDGPTEEKKREYKDAAHELRRAMAGMDVKVEMTPVSSAPPSAPPATQRLPEMA